MFGVIDRKKVTSFVSLVVAVIERGKTIAAIKCGYNDVSTGVYEIRNRVPICTVAIDNTILGRRIATVAIFGTRLRHNKRCKNIVTLQNIRRETCLITGLKISKLPATRISR